MGKAELGKFDSNSACLRLQNESGQGKISQIELTATQLVVKLEQMLSSNPDPALIHPKTEIRLKEILELGGFESKLFGPGDPPLSHFYRIPVSEYDLITQARVAAFLKHIETEHLSVYRDHNSNDFIQARRNYSSWLCDHLYSYVYGSKTKFTERMLTGEQKSPRKFQFIKEEMLNSKLVESPCLPFNSQLDSRVNPSIDLTVELLMAAYLKGSDDSLDVNGVKDYFYAETKQDDAYKQARIYESVIRTNFMLIKKSVNRIYMQELVKETSKENFARAEKVAVDHLKLLVSMQIKKFSNQNPRWKSS
jgi:hypothetical protein